MSDIKIESMEQCASYGIGRQMGDQLAQNGFDGIDFNVLALGIEDSYTGQELRIPVEEIQSAFTKLNEIMKKAQAEQEKSASAEGTAYLEKNAQLEGVVSLESGLQYQILEQGDAAAEKATKESTVRCHYHGTFIDGKTFDSSYDRGQPAEFPVSGVIAGWTEALQLMNIGAKWKLFIPYNLAYGTNGSPGSIPGCATLVFDVELLAIV
ncbi:MAG: FKBP-type peptidyl-prolyl cis-trans isomerase [Pseudomonadales bacterium]|nr:FKBP-type peptidyl-prolyl cis-trans isomerase [Pseudomonadales bacterium]NRA16808.1 FKBP-type peptidyl-prolyl cis-trans isomerase [Oceanospirillaceae bacterium]